MLLIECSKIFDFKVNNALYILNLILSCYVYKLCKNLMYMEVNRYTCARILHLKIFYLSSCKNNLFKCSSIFCWRFSFPLSNSLLLFIYNLISWFLYFILNVICKICLVGIILGFSTLMRLASICPFLSLFLEFLECREAFLGLFDEK